MKYEVITVTEIATSHGSYSTTASYADTRALVSAAKATQEKLLSIPTNSGDTKYKGQEMSNVSTTVIDLNEVKIHGYVIHEMTPIEKKKETK